MTLFVQLWPKSTKLTLFFSDLLATLSHFFGDVVVGKRKAKTLLLSPLSSSFSLSFLFLSLSLFFFLRICWKPAAGESFPCWFCCSSDGADDGEGWGCSGAPPLSLGCSLSLSLSHGSPSLLSDQAETSRGRGVLVGFDGVV